MLVFTWQLPQRAANSGPIVASKVSAPPAGKGAGVGVGGSCAWMISRRPGASKPAYFQALPWQALFEQNDVLSLPPGFPVVWQLEQVSSKTWWCMLIQLEL